MNRQDLAKQRSPQRGGYPSDKRFWSTLLDNHPLSGDLSPAKQFVSRCYAEA